MALARWQAPIQDAAGNVVPGATIEVRDEESGLLAALFSDRAGTVPLGNPFNADANGFAGFFAEGGAYRLTVTSGLLSSVWRYVAIGIAAEFDLVPGNAAPLNVGTGPGTVAAGDDARFNRPLATASQYRADAAGDLTLTPEAVWDAAAYGVLVDAATILVNFATGFDFGAAGNVPLPLGGNRTLGAASNLKNQKGVFHFTATGATRTLTLHASYRLYDGVPLGPYSIPVGTELSLAYLVDNGAVVITAALTRTL
ncbi:MAG: hypothetical protein K0R27_321 [Xanthobacteraceae bacterium]|jgi:hypothetical protein|nr:hypothetical protein [Xanthobacteraceae bacterium]